MKSELAAHRRVLVALAALLLSGLAGMAIGSRSPIAAQDSPPPMGITPVPGRHSEVQALFSFCVWETPNQQGCRQAEFKDNEYGRSYYKVDAAPGCGAWVVAPGTKPGLILEPGGANCQGFRVDFGAIYWFTVPPIVVTLPATFTPTVTPPPTGGATATGTSTPTPSPQGEATPTPHPIMTITPTPMFPELPSCSVQVLFYWAGDPAQGGLGGKVGDVTWCESCNSSCGLWMLGVDKATLDGFTSDANERVHQLWATVTVEAKR